MTHWAVIGGGLLGMTLALRLRQRGERVTLIEAADSLGGLASPWSIGDVVWDRHYHVILLSDVRLGALLDELGLRDQLRWTTTRTGFYSGGRLYSMSSAWEFLTFPPLNLVEKVRLAATILHASRIRDAKPLEALPVGTWLEKWSGRGAYEKVWLPLLRSKLGASHERTSAAFIWATIARLYAARRSGLKVERFGYVAGGYATILRRFEQVLREQGVEIVLGAATRSVRSGPGGTVEVAHSADRVDRFDRAVLTVPGGVAARLCVGLSDAEIASLRGIEYVGIVCASLLLNRPLGGFYVTNITDPGLPFTAVIEMSALVDRAAFGGRSLVYLPRYAPPDDLIFAKSDADLETEFVAGLSRMYPDLKRSDVAAFRVSRVPHVFALPTLGYSDRLPPVATSIPGVHIVNSAHIVNGTLNVDETVGLAERMVSRLT